MSVRASTTVSISPRPIASRSSSRVTRPNVPDTFAAVEELIARLQELLGPLEGEPVELGGGITNRNLRARFAGADYVIRLAGRDTDQLGIDQADERAAAEAAHRVGVAPAVAAHLADAGCLVCAYVDAAPVTPERVRALIDDIAAALRAVHSAGATLSRFSPFRIGERYAELSASRGV